MADNGCEWNALKTLEANQCVLRVRASEGDSLSFEIRFCVRQGCALSPILFNDINECIPGQAVQENPGIQVGANVYMWPPMIS